MKRKLIFALIIVSLGLFLLTYFKMNISDPEFMDDQLAEIERLIPERDALNSEVSQVPIAWHLDHMLKTINNICVALEASDPAEFESSFDFTRTMSLTLNYIPRGRAQAPDAVKPPDIIHTEALSAQLQEARTRLQQAFQLDEDAHFDHPIFGTINRGNTLRFIEVHTNHHLKIINDILQQ